MNAHKSPTRGWYCCLLLCCFSLSALAQSTAFTYQGRLNDGASPAQGIYDLRFAIYDAVSGPAQVGNPLTNTAVAISNGLFTVALDFGPGVFTGPARWLDIAVRTNGGGAFTPLAPRQPLTATPYALFASNSGSPAAHTHSAQDIVSGQIETARLNVGTNAASVAAGDHGHAGLYYSRAEVDALLGPLASRLATVETTVYTGVPPPPTGLSATAISFSAIALTWQYFPTPLETGFRIERQSEDNPDFVEVAVVPADCTSFTNTALNPTTTYTYRVRAYNAAGNSSYAGPASATTPAFECNNAIGVLAADPSIIYADAQFQVHVFTAGLSLSNPAAQVKLVSADSTETDLAFTSLASPNDLLVTVPAGMAAGARTIRVLAQNGDCGQLPGGLVISSSLTLNLAGVAPSHVSPSQSTSVTVSCQESPAGFVWNPHAYLIPNSGGSVKELDSVVFVNSSNLTAGVPAGLPSGTYHLLVLNPDGGAGLLPSALTVLSNEPPVVTEVAPGYVVAAAGQSFTIRGQGFNGPQVTLLCRTPLGVITQVSGSVSSVTSTSAVVTVDASGLPAGSICVVNLTNGDGGATAFSSLSIADPSLSATPWSFATTMLTARRSPALAYAPRTSTQGFLHALGGDSGSSAGALSTVESASVDPFGQLGGWTSQRYSLPSPRTFSGAARIGSYVYLVGGNLGSGTSPSVVLARVLDAFPSPAMPDYALEFDGLLGGGGVAAGTVQYRIAAVYAPGDESLPGGCRTVSVPAISNLSVRLSWPAVSGASDYRVYRAVGGAAFQLLAEVFAPTTTFTDTGLPSNPSQQPMPAGSLGVWQTAPNMNVAREGHAVVAVPRPGFPGQSYLFAIGGRGPGGARLTSIEYLTVNDDGSSSAWAMAAPMLSIGRADLGAWVLSSADNPQVPLTEYWLYAGPGTITGGGGSTVVEGARVSVGGLQAWAATDSLSGNAAGYAAIVRKGRLCVASGLGGASTTMREASPTGSFPDLTPWNASGQLLMQARIYSGFTRVGGVIYIVGGADGSGTPVSSTESAAQ